MISARPEQLTSMARRSCARSITAGFCGLILLLGFGSACRYSSDDPAAPPPFVESGLVDVDGTVTVYFAECIRPTLVSVVNPQIPKDGPFVASLEPTSESAPPISTWTIGDPPSGYRESVEVDRIESSHNLVLFTNSPGVGNRIVAVGRDVSVPRGERLGKGQASAA